MVLLRAVFYWTVLVLVVFFGAILVGLVPVEIFLALMVFLLAILFEAVLDEMGYDVAFFVPAILWLVFEGLALVGVVLLLDPELAGCFGIQFRVPRSSA